MDRDDACRGCGDPEGITQLQCPECGLSYADGIRQCPRCRYSNPGLPTAPRGASQQGNVAQQTRHQSATGTGQKAPASLDAIYTQCAWQRPDGRWLNSREMAEMEQLARQYASLKGGAGSLLSSIMSFGRKGGGSDQRIAAIRARVDALGIPFGVFQAYANSLD